MVDRKLLTGGLPGSVTMAICSITCVPTVFIGVEEECMDREGAGPWLN
ncbi:MAG: hypothetical protein R3186_02785 [Ruegeria sp.]|nr:hypothetical protein [uncultured Roseovarius sp.]MDX1742508.1 hypothetical protein [Ruegeria sp.]